MPYVFTTGYVPYNKTQEVIKIYLETLKDFYAETKGIAKEIIPTAIKARKDHIEVVGVYEVDQSNVGKYLQIEQKYQANYHNIEGLSYAIEVRLKAQEALEIMGLKMPEQSK